VKTLAEIALALGLACRNDHFKAPNGARTKLRRINANVSAFLLAQVELLLKGSPFWNRSTKKSAGDAAS
jgi:hypothetical protein